MCGICGLATRDLERVPDARRLEAMAAAQHHRGPDSRGFFRDRGIGLGFCRLSIIDLARGDQPIASEDGAVQLVCNGEIYNHQELRADLVARGHRFRSDSDAEVIVHLYQDLGAGCVERLRGMFAFALWDAGQATLLLARDRLGIKPLHYAETAEGLAFASELKGILAGASIERRVNPAALGQLFELGFTAGEQTMLEGVRRLPPAHLLRYRRGAVEQRPYWRLSFGREGRDASRSPRQWADALRGKLEESVRLHMRSDVDLGAWLSPGIDSSTVVALMARQRQAPVQTFSLRFADRDEDEIEDNPLLARAGDQPIDHRLTTLGDQDFDLLPRAVWYNEAPVSNGVEISRLRLGELAARQVKVVLSGEGADEVLGGYGWYKANKLLRPLGLVPGARRVAARLGAFDLRFANLMLARAAGVLSSPRHMGRERFAALIGPRGGPAPGELLSRELAARVGGVDPDEGIPRLPAEATSWHPLEQLQFLDLKIRMVDSVVHHLDRCSMAHSLEVRVPFLDHEVVELCARIPPALKLRGLQDKYLLRRATRGLLPRAIRRRKKRGLSSPLHRWLRGPLPPFVLDALSERSLREAGYFRPAAVQRLLEAYRAGSDRRGARAVASVLSVQLWHEQFITGRWRP